MDVKMSDRVIARFLSVGMFISAGTALVAWYYSPLPTALWMFVVFIIILLMFCGVALAHEALTGRSR